MRPLRRRIRRAPSNAVERFPTSAPRYRRIMKTTWKPHEKHGRLTMQSDLPDSVFAFPKQRKEPLTDAKHVRNAVARFDQVVGVSDHDRALAFANIEAAAKYYDVDLSETSWKDLGVHPQRDRKESARKGAETACGRARRNRPQSKARQRSNATALRRKQRRKPPQPGAASAKKNNKISAARTS